MMRGMEKALSRTATATAASPSRNTTAPSSPEAVEQPLTNVYRAYDVRAEAEIHLEQRRALELE